jgi:hypothetical protein
VDPEIQTEGGGLEGFEMVFVNRLAPYLSELLSANSAPSRAGDNKK